MRIALIAGEASGDTLGAGLAREILDRDPNAELYGVTGPKMQAAGVASIESIEALSVMGIAEVVREIPRLLKLRKRLIEQIVARKPDAVVGIDAPDFNLGLEKRLRRRGIPAFHYVSPSVWAWRQGRIREIKQSVDGMLTLFPFEARFYEEAGVPVRCVGHTLADDAPDAPDRAAARAALLLPDTAKSIVALMPGSRGSEVGELGPRFLAAARIIAAQTPGAEFVIPAANAKVQAMLHAQAAEHGQGVPLRIVDGQADTVLAACDVVMIASGTATLEALLAKRPMVVAYAVNAFTAFLLRGLGMLKTRHVSLPNLLCADPAVPELLQTAATPQALAANTLMLLNKPGWRQAQLDQFGAVHESLRRGASAQAADAIIEWTLAHRAERDG